MTRRAYLFLFLGGLLVAVLAGLLERAPGYMDAEYYYAGALRIVAGQGGTEPYLWNYLNMPQNLPAPSFAYWMPLPSIVAAAGLWIARPLGWWGARLGFFLLAACLPPLAARLSLLLTGKPSHARMAGLLALFPGFYMAYLTTTDSFPIYMVLGGLFVLLAFEGGWPWLDRRPVEIRLFVLGGTAGLLHLARADGLLWVGGALLAGLGWWVRLKNQADRPRWPLLLMRGLAFGLAVAAGYVLIMSPWFIRNLRVWGSLLPPGGSYTLWLTEYEQTMIYPVWLLTPEGWFIDGWRSILSTRLTALITNLQSTLAVQGVILLFPFILAGIWRLRGCPRVRISAAMWLLIIWGMTLVFPFAGINGGFFHSGAALQVVWWALAPLGMETIVQRYARWRKIADPRGLLRFATVLLVGGCALLSLLLYAQQAAHWGESPVGYAEIEQFLVEHGAQPGEPVVVNDPPGYWLASSGRPAIVVPYGGPSMLMAVSRQYRPRYLVLGARDPYQLADIYFSRTKKKEFKLLGSIGTTHIYRITVP